MVGLWTLLAVITLSLLCGAVAHWAYQRAYSSRLNLRDLPQITSQIDDPQVANCDDEYLSLLAKLPTAMKAGEIEVHYQPKLDARLNIISGAEALFRWSSYEPGSLNIERLIVAAEQTGAIADITRFVFNTALHDLAELRTKGHHLKIWVNLSATLLVDLAFTDEVISLLRSAPGSIGIEITETAIISDPETAMQNLEKYAANGISIAIDDYGTGLSSLAYLKRIPAQELKIDKSFVAGLTTSHRDPLLIRSSIDLAHALDMVVTAEGVENQMSCALLRVMGCDYLQGHYISHALPVNKLVEFLHDASNLSASVNTTLRGFHASQEL